MNYLIVTLAVFGGWAPLAFAAVPNSAQDSGLWRLVAKSHSIVSGRLMVPLDQVRESMDSGEGRYVDITVNVPSVLRGTPPADEISVRFHTTPNAYAPSAASLDELDGKEVILFLIQAGSSNYFTRDPNALQASSPDVLAAVEAEVKVQEALLKAYQRPAFPGIRDRSYRRVRKLVDSLTHPGRAEEALLDLQSLGAAAVPAMIHLMDDRRPLALTQIALPNAPGHWEGIAHYAPKCIVDVLTVLLGRITGESFSMIYNGGSERERATAINAWRIYLHHLPVEPENAAESRTPATR